MVNDISESKLLNELQKFHPVATTSMLAKHLNDHPNKIYDQLSKLQNEGKVNQLNLKRHVGCIVLDMIKYHIKNLNFNAKI